MRCGCLEGMGSRGRAEMQAGEGSVINEAYVSTHERVHLYQAGWHRRSLLLSQQRKMLLGQEFFYYKKCRPIR